MQIAQNCVCLSLYSQERAYLIICYAGNPVPKREVKVNNFFLRITASGNATRKYRKLDNYQVKGMKDV